MAERNYEQAGLEAVNRLFRPMEAGMDAQRQLQRQAAGIGLQRQLQLDDAATKRQQTLDDAATVRSQQVSDATLAHERGLDRITHQIEKSAESAEDIAKKRRAETLKDKKDEAATTLNNLLKKGINLGFSVTDINNASLGELNSFMRELDLETEIIKANKKPHAELLERLKSMDRTDEGKEILQEIWGTADAIDWEDVARESKSTLADIFSEANVKLNLRKYGKGAVLDYKRLKVLQHQLMKETGIYDLIMDGGSPGSTEAAKAIGADTAFQMQLTQAIKDGWMPGDQRPAKAQRILDLLNGGQLMAAAQMLDDEGVAGNAPLVEAYTKWAASSQLAKQAGIQDRIFRSQGSTQKLTEVGRQLNGLVSRHDWLERAVDLTDIPEIMNDLQGMQGGGVNPPVSMEPGDPGFGGTNANAGGSANSDMLSSNDITNLINPAANATASTPTEVTRTRVNLSDTEEAEFQDWWNNNPNVQAWKKDLGNPNKSPDDIADKYDYRKAWKGGDVPEINSEDGRYHWGTGPLDNPWKDPDHPTFPTLLYNPEDYGPNSPANIDRKEAFDQTEVSFDEEGKPVFKTKARWEKPTQSWFGRKATELKQAIAPKADLSFISESMGPLYDDPEAGPGGIGDVAIVMADHAATAWLAGTGLSLLRSTPGTLKKVKDLAKANPGGIPVGELAKTLGAGAALESLKAFLKNPNKMKSIKDSVMRAGNLRGFVKPPTPPFIGPLNYIPKGRRLNFTPPPSGKPIITPPPTPPRPKPSFMNTDPTGKNMP